MISTTLAQTTAAPDPMQALGGVFVFAIALVALVIFVAWIVFPLLMWSRLGEVRDEIRRSNSILERIASQTKPNTTQPEKSASVSYSNEYVRSGSRLGAGTVLAITAVFILLVVMIGFAARR
jgi:uncharacterized membrane protein